MFGINKRLIIFTKHKNNTNNKDVDMPAKFRLFIEDYKQLEFS